jgi:hypothetical protein
MGGYIGRGQPVAAETNSVESADIVDDAVTNAKIATNAVTGDSIAANAVGNSELSDNAVDTAEIAASAVETAKINDDAVTEDKLANAINTAIAANTAKVTNATHTGDVTGATTLTIAADAVDGTKIADDAIGSEHIAAGSVDNAHLASGIDAAKLTTGTLPIARIANDAIDSQHYADGSIDTAHIADDAVDADKLANAINTSIAANTAKVTNATHSGEVTGATALTIADNVVDEANLKISNSPTNGQFLSAQSGNTGGLTWADAAGTLNGLTDCTVSASDPAATSNVSAVGHLWINKTSGEVYICTGVTNNDNTWANIGAGEGGINEATISKFNIFNDSSCKALWHLDSNKTDAGGNYNLTSSGTEVWSTGKFSTAWDGNGSNILYYSSSNIVGTSAHSASFWYKNATASQNNKRVLCVNGGTGGQCAGFSNYSNSLGFYTGSGINVGGSIPSVNRRVEIPDSSVNDNAWHHLAWTITSGGTWVIYLDGSAWTGTANVNDSRSFCANGTVSGSYVIITGYDITSGSPHECDCLIDQVRVFDRVITATEVATLYGLG